MSDLSLQTSTFWIGFCGLMQAILWVKIMTVRAPQDPKKQHIGNIAESNKDPVWACTTRAHGNFAENAPMMCLLLLAIDAADVLPKSYVNNLGAVWAFGRIFHMFGLWGYQGASLGRIFGATLSLGGLMAGGGMAAWSAVKPLMDDEDGMAGVKQNLGVLGAAVVTAIMFASKKLD